MQAGSHLLSMRHVSLCIFGQTVFAVTEVGVRVAHLLQIVMTLLQPAATVRRILEAEYE